MIDESTSSRYSFPAGTWTRGAQGQYAMDIRIDGLDIENFVFRLYPVVDWLDNFTILDYSKSYLQVRAEPVSIPVRKVRVDIWGDGISRKTKFLLSLDKVDSLSAGNYVELSGDIATTFPGTYIIDRSVNVLNSDDSENTVVFLQRAGADYTPTGSGLNVWTDTTGTLTNTVVNSGNTETAMRISLNFTSHPMMLLQNSEYVKDYLVIFYSQQGEETRTTTAYPETMSLWNYPIDFSFTGSNSIPPELLLYYGDTPQRAPYDLPRTRTFRVSGGQVIEVYYTIMRYTNENGQWKTSWLQYDETTQRPKMGRKLIK